MKPHLILPCIFVPLFLADASFAAGPPIYWKGGAGTWDTPGNWSTTSDGAGAAGVPGTANVATFNITGITAAETISLVADQAVSGLAVSSGVTSVNLEASTAARILSIGADGIVSPTTFTIGGAGVKAVNVVLTADQKWSYNSSSVAGITITNGLSWGGAAASGTLTLGGTASNSSFASTIAGVISDGAAGKTLNITVNGDSTNNRWVFGGTNTYSGVTTISSGAITLTNTKALGATTGNTVVGANGSIFMRNGIGTFNEPLNLTGAGVDSKGTLRNVGGTNTWTGAITAQTSATSTGVSIGADGVSIFNINQPAVISTDATGTLRFIGTGTTNVNANITGGAAVTNVASLATVPNGGTVVMSGDAKTYTGATTSAGGAIRVNTTLSGTSSFSVGDGGFLQGAGGVINAAAPVTVNGSGTLATTIATLAPGTIAGSVGTLTMGALTLGPNSRTSLDTNFDAAATSDQLIVSSLNINTGALLDVNLLGSAGVIGSPLLVIKNSGVWSGLFTVNGVSVADDTTFTTAGNTYLLDYNYTGPQGQGVALTLISIPEPTMVGLACVAAAAVGFRRRRA